MYVTSIYAVFDECTNSTFVLLKMGQEQYFNFNLLFKNEAIGEFIVSDYYSKNNNPLKIFDDKLQKQIMEVVVASMHLKEGFRRNFYPTRL